MEASSKKFFDCSDTFLGLAEFYNSYRGDESTEKNSDMLDSLPLIDEIITLEEDRQANTLQNTKICLEIKEKELSTLKDKVQDLVSQLHKNLKYLETQREPISSALISGMKQKEDCLACSDPEKTMKLVQCVSDAISTLGQPLKPLPDGTELEKVIHDVENDLVVTANVVKEHQELSILLANVASGLEITED